MALCEIPTELPVTLPDTGDGLFYCPVLLSKGRKVGYADPRFVVCKHLEECRARNASIFNHTTSKKNTHFRAHPDRSGSEVKIDGFPVVAHRKSYIKDPLLAWSERQKLAK